MDVVQSIMKLVIVQRLENAIVAVDASASIAETLVVVHTDKQNLQKMQYFVTICSADCNNFFKFFVTTTKLLETSYQTLKYAIR